MDFRDGRIGEKKKKKLVPFFFFSLLNKPLYYILINPNIGVDSDLTTL